MACGDAKGGGGMRVILYLIAVLGLVASAPDCWAQPGSGSTLDRIERQLADPRLDDAGFDRLRLLLEREREALNSQRAVQREEGQSVQAVLDSLGPAPSAGQPPESAVVANARQQLQQRLQRTADAVKEIDLAMVRLQSLQERLNAESRQKFTRQLAYRGAAPLGLEFWRQLASDFPATLERAASRFAQPEADFSAFAVLRAVLAGSVIAFVGFGILHVLQRRVLAAGAGRRTRTLALLSWMRWALLPLLALFGADLAVSRDRWFEQTLVGAVLAQTGLVLLWANLWLATARTLLRGGDLASPPLELSDRDRAVLLGRIRMLVAIAFVAAPFVYTFGGAASGIASRDLVFALAAVFQAVMLAAISDVRIWRRDLPGLSHETQQRRSLAASMLQVVAVGVVLAVVLGYFISARYFAFGALQSILVIGAAGMLRAALQELLRRPETAPAAEHLSEAEQDAQDQRETLNATWRFGVGLLLDLIVLVGAAALLLLVWGMSPRTLGGYALDLVYGISIGTVTISLVDICAALAVLAAGVAVTRFLSRGLNLRLERQTQIDPGVRNSVVTGIAYAGFVLSGIVSVTILGINLSNLAIIAGALSVGIGFGLQNIVNNFVSGLILLIERPVKVGDWVVVGNREGYVRRINVRSTEIETFPRASVIIPNSELISGVVMNWTHRDKFGRVDVDVGLAYGTDIEKAEAVLLRCMAEHPEVLPEPKPYALFRAFGDNALMFALRGHIANVERRVLVESALRKSIYAACRQEGIVIPYAQNEVHLADLDRIEAMVRNLSRKPGAAP